MSSAWAQDEDEISRSSKEGQVGSVSYASHAVTWIGRRKNTWYTLASGKLDVLGLATTGAPGERGSVGCSELFLF